MSSSKTTTMKTNSNNSKTNLQTLSGGEAVKLLIDLTAIGHPAVRIPKEKTLPALLRANPREAFLRRLAASNN